MLFIHHSNDLKKLTEILLRELSGFQTAVLQSEQILVQNPGIKRWLQQQISLSQGIAANIDFPLPSRFIWDIFLTQFNDVDNLSAYDGEVLRWQLMSVLQQNNENTELAVVNSYLVGDDKALSRFQLAEKLAGLYDQYLVYRPQMIGDWEQGKPANSSTELWQACLWRLLRVQNAQPHRADLIKRLLQQLYSKEVNLTSLPERLFVFAISAMSPLYLNVLAALGQHIDVHILNFNPCEHYWGDIQTKKELIRQGEKPQVLNELLASLGKQGRDFIDQFYDNSEQYVDENHFVEIKPDSLLKQIKYDILHLFSEPSAEARLRDDGSIQIISCYSELRELQVLHDHLLDWLQHDESLQAHDIVVMCPDINTLAPYIDAVFGQQPEHKKIPYSISDNNTLSSSPLLQVILDWINLPSSRLTVNEVLSWLELPALQRAVGLDELTLEIIQHWIKTSHIHWGLDHSHKTKLGLNESDLNTWQHGLNQLLTAYIMNEDVEMFEQHVVSETVLSYAEFQALGQLQRFLDDLSNWSRRLSQPATLQLWQQHINALIDNFLDLDDEEEWLLKPLRDEMVNWQSQVEQACYSETIDGSLIHYILQNAINQGSAHHYYLSGGINFCNLIPMRTLPFRVVCLIGMNDNNFPRNDVPVQLDLISINPQKGDRSRREDDRYMFLQSLLSAEDKFYLSYVGKNKKDDSTIEPSVVISELLDHIEQSIGLRINISETSLQSFSDRNFEQGSYAEQWHISSETSKNEAFSQPIEIQHSITELSLDELINFYRNPARYFMQNTLNLSLSEYDQSIDDDEVFALDPLQRYSINTSMLHDIFENGLVHKEKYLNSGVLSEFNSGLIQFEEQNFLVTELFQNLSGHPAYSGFSHFSASLKLSQVELMGQVFSYSDQGLLQLNQSTLKGKYLFRYWIQHCFLCASGQIKFCEFLFKDKMYSFQLLSEQQAKTILEHLIDGFIQGYSKVLPFYVDTAYEYEKTRQEKNEISALQKIQSLWGEDNFSPFYEALDIYWQTSLKNADTGAGLFPEEFFSLSSRYMTPVLANMDSKV